MSDTIFLTTKSRGISVSTAVLSSPAWLPECYSIYIFLPDRSLPVRRWRLIHIQFQRMQSSDAKMSKGQLDSGIVATSIPDLHRPVEILLRPLGVTRR